MGKFKDLTGQRFGKLLAIGPIDKDKWGEFVWLCACDCGGIVKARGSSLTGKHTKSCGCIKKERIGKEAYIHGDAGTRLYQIWRDMIRRCYNPKEENYKYYGKKGISVFEVWRDDYLVFKEWALSNGYHPSLTIDRINHFGDYKPDNCQWLTKSENSIKAHKDRKEAGVSVEMKE